MEGLPKEIKIDLSLISRDDLMKLKLIDLVILKIFISLAENDTLVLRTKELLDIMPFMYSLTAIFHRLYALSVLDYIDCLKKDKKINIVIKQKTFDLFRNKT